MEKAWPSTPRELRECRKVLGKGRDSPVAHPSAKLDFEPRFERKGDLDLDGGDFAKEETYEEKIKKLLADPTEMSSPPDKASTTNETSPTAKSPSPVQPTDNDIEIISEVNPVQHSAPLEEGELDDDEPLIVSETTSRSLSVSKYFCEGTNIVKFEENDDEDTGDVQDYLRRQDRRSGRDSNGGFASPYNRQGKRERSRTPESRYSRRREPERGSFHGRGRN